MQRYERRNPEGHHEDVEAIQLSPDTLQEILEWTGGREVEEIDALDPNHTYVGVNYENGNGHMLRASEGDYVIKNGNGIFHSRWPEAFLAMYKPKE